MRRQTLLSTPVTACRAARSHFACWRGGLTGRIYLPPPRLKSVPRGKKANSCFQFNAPTVPAIRRAIVSDVQQKMSAELRRGAGYPSLNPKPVTPHEALQIPRSSSYNPCSLDPAVLCRLGVRSRAAAFPEGRGVKNDFSRWIRRRHSGKRT